MPRHGGDGPIEKKCPPYYHWDDLLDRCVPNTPTPTPPPTPPPNRLGNPSVSNVINFTYSMPGTQPSGVNAQDLEPFPPLPGGIGEDTTLTLASDESNYTYGTDKATLRAKLTFNKDAAPLANREIIFDISGETFVQQTDQNGVATLEWQPYGVPGPGDPTSRKYFAQAAFRGY